MSEWQRFHMNDTVGALAISEEHRFLVKLREPPGASRQPIECYRGNLEEAQAAADRLVQAYYPHDCYETGCGDWRQS